MRSWILVLLLLGARDGLATEVIHSSFGPGDAYDDGGGPDSGHFLGTFGPFWEHAELFSPARDMLLAGVEIALGSVQGSPEVIIDLTGSDPAGDPGAVLESFSVTAPEAYAAGGGIQSAASALEPRLRCGDRYWIVARSASPADSLVRWHINSVSDRGPVGILQDGGAWSTSGEGSRGAFRVTGIPDESGVACPEAAPPALVTGKAIDRSDPLDGLADSAGSTIGTIDLELNGSPRDPFDDRVREDRGILEFDVSSFVGRSLASALLEFEISGPVSGTINVFAYAGDGVVAIADFQETSTLAASPALTVSSVSIDVTAPVQTLLDRGVPMAGFLIALTEEDQRLSIHNVGFPPEPRLLLEASTSAPRFLRGDCDGDGRVTGQVSDAVFLLAHNFLGGPAPGCLAACDANADGLVLGRVTDAVHLLAHNFLGGPPPPPPFPECGASSLDTDGTLGCETPPGSCKQ